MTAHYARLSDKTVREHWEKARKVNAAGAAVSIDPDGPLGDAAWAKQRLARATQALPERLLRAAGREDLPARQRLPDLPDVRHHARVPAPAPRPAAGHPADHHRRRGRRPARVAEMNRQVAAQPRQDHHRPGDRRQDSQEAAADAS